MKQHNESHNNSKAIKLQQLKEKMPEGKMKEDFEKKIKNIDKPILK